MNLHNIVLKPVTPWITHDKNKRNNNKNDNNDNDNSINKKTSMDDSPWTPNLRAEFEAGS